MRLETPSAEDRGSLVQFQRVNKSYGGTNLVVRDLDLDVADGEFMTLLGPSGSGKTTTLMMLAGFESPSSGDILLSGERIQSLAPHRRNIGVVFQNYALFPHMSVAENLAYPLKARGRPKGEIEAKVSRALAMVKMAAFAERRPANLSGGQQQRVALARALVFEPALVLMDEPLGALDKNLREHMQLEIKRLHRELGITILYVTHDQAEALTMSDRIAIFNEGRIEQLDEPAALYERPLTPFVAAFIGDNNALHARVVATSDADCRLRLRNGVVIEAVSADALDVDDEVLVSIRPERIRLTNPLASDNSITVTVREIIYLGDHIQVHAEAVDGTLLRARVPNTQERPPLHPGKVMTVAWSHLDSIAMSIRERG